MKLANCHTPISSRTHRCARDIGELETGAMGLLDEALDAARFVGRGSSEGQFFLVGAMSRASAASCTRRGRRSFCRWALWPLRLTSSAANSSAVPIGDVAGSWWQSAQSAQWFLADNGQRFFNMSRWRRVASNSRRSSATSAATLTVAMSIDGVAHCAWFLLLPLHSSVMWLPSFCRPQERRRLIECPRIPTHDHAPPPL